MISELTDHSKIQQQSVQKEIIRKFWDIITKDTRLNLQEVNRTSKS